MRLAAVLLFLALLLPAGVWLSVHAERRRRSALDAFPGTPESTLAYLKQDIPRWAEVFKIAKIEPQ